MAFQKGNVPWNKVGLTTTCAICGTVFPTAKSYLKSGRKCCSTKCANQYRSKFYRIVYPNLQPSPELSYVIGVLIGDGCISNYHGKYSVILNVTDETFALSFKTALRRLGLHPRLNSSIPKTKSRRYFRVTAMSKTFAEWYIQLRPEDILSIAKSFPLEFLRGFYEAEGTATGHRLCVFNTQPWKLEIYQELLHSLDFNTSHLSYPRIPPSKAAHELHILGGQPEQARFLHSVNPCIKWGRHASRISDRI